MQLFIVLFSSPWFYITKQRKSQEFSERTNFTSKVRRKFLSTFPFLIISQVISVRRFNCLGFIKSDKCNHYHQWWTDMNVEGCTRSLLKTFTPNLLSQILEVNRSLFEPVTFWHKLVFAELIPLTELMLHRTQVFRGLCFQPFVSLCIG